MDESLAFSNLSRRLPRSGGLAARTERGISHPLDFVGRGEIRHMAMYVKGRNRRRAAGDME